jgi:hypothetical protein
MRLYNVKKTFKVSHNIDPLSILTHKGTIIVI